MLNHNGHTVTSYGIELTVFATSVDQKGTCSLKIDGLKGRCYGNSYSLPYPHIDYINELPFSPRLQLVYNALSLHFARIFDISSPSLLVNQIERASCRERG